MVITDTVAPCFRIVSLSPPTKGTASMENANMVKWKIDKLGVTQSEGAVLEFSVQHIGPCTGDVGVNESITYSDKEGNHVTFPSPTLRVDCDIVIPTEPCPEPIDITIDGCRDAVEYDVGELELESLGRILQLDVTIRNACPHKRVALAVLLNEVDAHGNEYRRGLKTVTVPAHTRETCRDVTVRCIKFVLPEDLDVSGSHDSICNRRKFKARLFAHYIDNDFACCNLTL